MVVKFSNSKCEGLVRTVAGLSWLAIVSLALLLPAAVRSDEPYARSRDYDLQDIRTHLWFDLAQRGVRGAVIERVVALREGVSVLTFDSLDLDIQSVTAGRRKTAKFYDDGGQADCRPPHPAERGETGTKFLSSYDGQPKKGLYFVLPDKNYPGGPAKVWTQGEAEDTRYLLPIYDYPNDRMTSEMILTVPEKWTTRFPTDNLKA